MAAHPHVFDRMKATPGVSARRARVHRFAVAISVASLAAVAGSVPARASTQPQILPSAGTCTFAGTATFAPPEQLLPASNVTVTISGGGSCYGADVPLGESMNLQPNFAGTGLGSCAIGETSMFGEMTFAGGVPASYLGGATYVGGPATATVTIASAGLAGTLALAWTNPSAIAACPLSGTVSTPVTGVFVFVSP